MKTNKKIAFISPRYLQSSAGGAEVACRLFAENLAFFKGITTEILTTCAEDHFTWLNKHSEGSFKKNGVTVRRFKVNERKETHKFDQIAQKLYYKQKISFEEEKFFFDNNLNSQHLYDFIKEQKDNYAFFIFMPYLFGLTVNGAQICPKKTLLIPCLHNEPFAKLQMINKIFQISKGIICNAPPERDLVLRLSKTDPEKALFVGIGVDPPLKVAGKELLLQHKITSPYLFYCGRREIGKNFNLLLEMFREYKKQNNNQLKLVTAGSGYVDLRPSEKDFIIDLGYVPEDVKAMLYKNALLTCQPSTKESFSFVIMESWLQKRPVIGNVRSEVTDYWINKCKGGFSFKDFYEFEEILNYSLNNSEALIDMGKAGYEFTLSNFKWEIIIERFLKALIHFGFVL
ncbi:MAG: glycosyltransferase family 4 protein [Candidatus Aureabacteria bacterium]|nr:glycosyltransferase family 4 protein [Candidatus Auribacterota bacterium]